MASTSESSASPTLALAAVADAVENRSLPTQPQNPSAASHSLDETENHPSLHGLTGRSLAMRRLIQQMRRMAPHLTLATVEGEEGTGRSLAARALHAAGPVAAHPFVPCVASHFFSPANDPTVQSGLHSHWSHGTLHQAHGGMLFLDRVHDLSPEQQDALAHFLHWLDDRHAHTTRHSTTGAIDSSVAETALPAQIVFSTSVPLRNPSFREDLASRLCSIRFHLPPLVQRREDIPLLAQIFIQRFARTYGKAVRGLGPGTIAPLLRHTWPGNVRELEETITAAALETESQWIRPIDFPPFNTSGRQPQANTLIEPSGDADLNLDRAIRNHVTRVLARTRGNKLRAAQLLGISRSTLYRILAAETPAAQDATP